MLIKNTGHIGCSDIDLAVGNGEPLLRRLSFLAAPLSLLCGLSVFCDDWSDSTSGSTSGGAWRLVAIVKMTLTCNAVSTSNLVTSNSNSG